ncbi:MAG: hypothetical protein KKA73_29155 [Chloroflexi bacterium]|nr:hypothetical protein [Chloroflexota bacterium]MBU1751764.1 hypothetical protein [Chloroflexota bacterium]MBU1880255.1 hypothetical protein [Chloroflexota bacterium]
MADEQVANLLRDIGTVSRALAALTDDYRRQPNGAIPMVILHHLEELARLRETLLALDPVGALKSC